MALVSYGSSDDSGLSDNDELQNEKVYENKSDIKSSLNNLNGSNQKNPSSACDVISDEEDDTHGQPLDDQDTSIFNDKDVPGNDTTNSLFASLPASQNSNNANSLNTNEKGSKRRHHIDENEDIDTIPERKIYEGETLEIKPKRKDALPMQNGPSSRKNPQKRAPVRIMAPLLLSDRDIEEDRPPKKVFARSSKTSGVLGLLPKPKNT